MKLCSQNVPRALFCAGLLLSSTSWAQASQRVCKELAAGQAVSCSDSAAPQPLPPSKEEIQMRPVIPHVPFPRIDPNDPERILKDDDLVQLWNGTMVQAKEYYDWLNEQERRLNQWGYSLKNREDQALVKRIALDYGLIDMNRSFSQDLRALFDPKLMERLQDPTALQNIVQEETAKRLERYIDKLYKESLMSPLGDLGVPDLILDPKLIKTRNTNLKVVIEKYTNDKWGDTKDLGATADALFIIEGDSAYARMLARAQIDAYLVGRPLNVAHAFAEGVVPDKGKSTFKTGIKILGYDLLPEQDKQKQLQDPAGAGPKKPAELPDQYLWSLGPKDFGIEPAALAKEFREGIPLFWTWGIVSIEGELGIYGRAGFDFDIHMANLSLAGNIGPYQEIGTFAKVAGKLGVGNFSIADAGLVGDVSLMNAKTKLEGDVRLIFEQGEPTFVAKVKAYNKVSALQGSMYVFAKAKVPVVGLPPWEEKEYRHDIYKGDKALDLPELVLYSYEKRVGLLGYSLLGAPQPEDMPGVDLDNALTQTFKEAVQGIADKHQRVIQDLQSQVSLIESNRAAMQLLIDDLQK